MFDFPMTDREREIAMIERTGYPSWQQREAERYERYESLWKEEDDDDSTR